MRRAFQPTYQATKRGVVPEGGKQVVDADTVCAGLQVELRGLVCLTSLTPPGGSAIKFRQRLQHLRVPIPRLTLAFLFEFRRARSRSLAPLWVIEAGTRGQHLREVHVAIARLVL